MIRTSREATLYILNDPPETATILLHAKRNVGGSLWKCRFDRLTPSLLHFFSPIYFNSRTPELFTSFFKTVPSLFLCDRNVSAFLNSIWISDQKVASRRIGNRQYFLLIVPFLLFGGFNIMTSWEIYNSMTKRWHKEFFTSIPVSNILIYKNGNCTEYCHEHHNDKVSIRLNFF